LIGSHSPPLVAFSSPSVSQSGLKTGGDATRMVHVTSSQRSRGDEGEDGWVDATDCIRLFYPNFVILVILGHKSNLVISFPINRTLRAGGEASTSTISLPHLWL
jgi:hypothetical protein